MTPSESAKDWLLRVVLGFSYIFLVMTSYYMLKPVRNSFFLGEKGYGNLPVAHLLVLASTSVAVVAYTRATRRLGPARLVTATNAFFLLCIVGFWAFLTQVDTSTGWLEWLRDRIAWVYFCFVSVFAVFAVTMFWSVIHTIFSSDAAAKYYGIIGSGATIGAMSGGLLTNQLAKRVGTENLLVVAAAILAPCLVLGSVLVRISGRRAPADTAESVVASRPILAKHRSAVAIFRGSPYLCVLGLIVMLTVVITVLDEYRYYKLIEAEFEGLDDERTAFFGSVPAYSNAIGLIFSLVLTGLVQTIWGPRPGMLLFVGLVLISAIAFLFLPNLNTVFYSVVALQAVGYSIYQWSRELLYTQTTPEEKFVAKGFIDTFMFRAGAGTAALALLGAAAIGSGEDGLLTSAVTHLSFITIPLGLLLGALAWWVSGRFQQLKAQREQAVPNL